MTRRARVLVLVASSGWLCAILLGDGQRRATGSPGVQRTQATSPPERPMFAPSSDCVACHNNLVDAERRGRLDRRQLARHHDGERRPRPVRAGQHPSRDDGPPVARRAISRTSAPPAICRPRRRWPHAAGGKARCLRAFRERAPARRRASTRWRATACRCTVCHQIAADRLGTRDSFNGNFVVAAPRPDGMRRAFGPLAVDPGRRRDHALGDRLRAGARRRTSASRSSARPVTRSSPRHSARMAR